MLPLLLPSPTPLYVLHTIDALMVLLLQLRQQFYNVQKQMIQASKWRESITQEPYDLKFLSAMASQMDIRQELWMYVEVSTHAIKEWKAMLFKKVRPLAALLYILLVLYSVYLTKENA